MENNNSRSWQLAFWVITGFLIAVMCVGVPAIIANDIRIEEKVDEFKDCMKDDITQIKISVARIEQIIRRD